MSPGKHGWLVMLAMSAVMLITLAAASAQTMVRDMRHCNAPADRARYDGLRSSCAAGRDAWAHSDAAYRRSACGPQATLTSNDGQTCWTTRHGCADLCGWARICGYPVNEGTCGRPPAAPKRAVQQPQAPVESPPARTCKGQVCFDPEFGDPATLLEGGEAWAKAMCARTTPSGELLRKGSFEECVKALPGLIFARMSHQEVVELAGDACASVDEHGTFWNACNYPIVVRFRTVGGGCFLKTPGEIGIDPNGRVHTQANAACNGLKPERGEFRQCPRQAWSTGACKLAFKDER